MSEATDGTWQLDQTHSTVQFEVGYLEAAFRGGLGTIDATLTVADGSARLEGSADPATVQVKDENLAGHLQTPDFFDSGSNPRITFEADDVALAAGRVTANGTLTLRGVTLPVTASGTAGGPFTDGYGRERISLSIAGTIDRTAYGIAWNAPLPTGDLALADAVTVRAELFFTKA